MAFLVHSNLTSKYRNRMMIGAWIYIIMKEDDTSLMRQKYVSFGKYDEATDTDGFGVKDLDIFWYFKNITDVLNIMHDSSRSEFRIVKYDANYVDITN